MAKKKRITMTAYLEKFANETLSAVIGNEEEAKIVKEQLKKCGIRYAVGDLPVMQNGKAVGIHKQITVLDGNKLRELLTQKR